MFENRAATRCVSCGETLYDGDTAYCLGGRYYCVSCVDDALLVCRGRREKHHSYEYDDQTENLYAEQEWDN